MSLRARLHLIPVLLSVLLPVLVLAQSDPAQAQDNYENVPDWAVPVADDIVNGCLDIPESLLGTGTASVAYAAPPANVGAPLNLTGAGTGVGGRVVMTGARAGLVGAVAAGAFCGTINLLDWVFPNYGPAPLTTSVTGYSLSPTHSCSGIPGALSTDRCVTATASAGWFETDQAFSLVSKMYSATSSSTGAALRLRQPNGTLTFSVAGNGTGQQTLTIACPTNDLEGRCAPHAHFDPDGYATYCTNPAGNNMLWCGWAISWGPNPPQEVIPPDVAEQHAAGWPTRLKQTLRCITGGGTEQERITYSPTTMSGQGENPWPGRSKCSTGEIPVRILVERQAWSCNGTSTWTCSWQEYGSDLVDWTMPTNVKNNGPARQCWMVGVTFCPEFDPDPENDEGTKYVGGAGGLPVPKQGPGTKTTTIPGILDDVPWPEDNPAPTTVPSSVPATSAVPTSSPTATTVPTPTTTTPDECVGSHCVGGPSGPLPPETEGAECLPNGWGWFNPIEWVLKPVKCALMWAFWDQESADEMTGLWGETGSDWTAAVEFTDAVGPCVELAGQSICSSFVLGFTLPSSLSTLITAAVVFFTSLEIVGLFSRITGG